MTVICYENWKVKIMMQNSSWQQIENQGRRLSILWDCAVIYPAFNNNVFQ
jgi:hypothetical protein